MNRWGRWRGLAVAAALLASAPEAWAKPCPGCSTEVAEETRFCTTCGHAFRPMKDCPECHAHVFGDARFCSACGYRFPFTLEDEERFAGEVVRARTAYLHHLRQLEHFYEELQVPDRAQAVRSERETCETGAIVQSSTPGAATGTSPGDETPAADVPHLTTIAEADVLFEEAEGFRRRLNPLARHENLSQALERYQRLLLAHPDSDKADDAAYWIGYVYESRYHTNYERAVEFYRKCVAWNPTTITDARHRIAYILDYNVRDRAAALEAYRDVVASSSSMTEREHAERRIASLERRIGSQEPDAPPEGEPPGRE